MTWRHFRNTLISASSCLAAMAVGQPPDGSSPREKAAIVGDPPFKAERLTLGPLPAATGPATRLFDGTDLSGWNTWLGYAQPLTTYSPVHGKPIGLDKDPGHVFQVVSEDGGPAILATGKTFGGLITKKSYGNYHLRLEFKWGRDSWFPGFPRNNGIIYHSQEPYGAFFGTWMSGIEFEIVPHSVGMLLTVGKTGKSGTFADVDWNVGAKTTIGHDPAIAYPYRRYMPGGRLVSVVVPAFNAEAAEDAEKPIGEWNVVDVYAVGNASVHVVNGRPVLKAIDLTVERPSDGERSPLVEGHIQLQSEGSEVYFRNISIEPISRLPEIIRQK